LNATKEEVLIQLVLPSNSRITLSFPFISFSLLFLPQSSSGSLHPLFPTVNSTNILSKTFSDKRVFEAFLYLQICAFWPYKIGLYLLVNAGKIND
jgi:hypothetical protein